MIELEDSKWDKIEELLNNYLDSFITEFNLYIQAIKNIQIQDVKNELNLPEYEILEMFSLTREKLRDPYYIPEIIQLAYYMKENNFNHFENYWNTFGYYHHKHGYKIKDIMDKLKPLSEKIEEFKVKKLEEFLERKFTKKKEEEIHISKPFINSKFSDFNLPAHYDAYIKLINESIEVGDFYRILPILLRCLFENLLYDLFSDSLHISHNDLYYNKFHKRAMVFSKLILLLDFLKDDEYKPFVLNKINKNTIDILKEIKEIGNYSVHDTLEMFQRIHINDWRSKTDLALKHLLTSYKKLNGNKLEIRQDRLILIKEKLGIIKKAHLTTKRKKKKRREKQKRKTTKIEEKNKRSNRIIELNAKRERLMEFYNFLKDLFNRMEQVSKPKDDINFKDNRNYIYFKYQIKDKEGLTNLNSEEVKYAIIDASDKLKRFYTDLGYFISINEVNKYITGYHLKLLYSRIKIEINKVSIHQSKVSLIPSPKNLKASLSYFLYEINKLMEGKISRY